MPIVSNTQDNIEITAKENETIFDAFDAQGKELPYGCLSGSCTACMVEIINGQTNLTPMDPIEARTVAMFKQQFPELTQKDLRLSCRATIKGDVSFTPFKK